MFNLNLLAVLQFNIATCAEANEMQTMLQDGLVTETEYLKKLIDLATRHNALPVETLGQFADAAFPYGVATGKWEDGEESCQYSDDFATLRDAIIAWEEYSPGAAWSRIQYRVDEFVYGLDPYKVLRAKKVTDDKGEKRTLYMKCDAAGNFVNQEPVESPLMTSINRFNSHFGGVTEDGKYRLLIETLPPELLLRTARDQGASKANTSSGYAARYLAGMDIDELRSALVRGAEAIYERF